MKSAKLALMVALVLIVLRTGLCVVMLVFGAISLNNETNRAAQEPEKMQGSAQQELQAMLQLEHAALHEKSIQREQIALYGAIIGLAWNLVLAGLLFFAIRRFPKFN